MNLIGSAPTTPVSTGFRFYDQGQTLMIIYEGTPANETKTLVLTPAEARRDLAWSLQNDERYSPACQWLADRE